MQDKIDIVLIWVDGNDKEWQKEKAKYYEKENNTRIDASNKRYRDWDNLKYLFRGIDKFMPWVNNVFFITNGQKPDWLNTKYEKLKWVKHSDYIPKECLPTFNCNPIELNFHRIKELSEQFIYFNDDIFVLKNTQPEDFFKNGLPCETAIFNPITPSTSVVSYLWFNNMAIINKYFNKKECFKKNKFKYLNLKYGKDLLRTISLNGWHNFLGFKFTHLATSLLKSTYFEVWEKEEEELMKSSRNRFRSKEDYTQYLFKDWQLAKGNFYPRSPKIGKMLQIRNESDVKIAKNIIENQTCKLCCINDAVEDDDEFEKLKNELNTSFEIILSEKSKFEL